MSYEYKRRESFDLIPDDDPKPVDDKELLQKLYKNSKFLLKEFRDGAKAKEQWVFLSHSNKDFQSVRLLRNALEEEDLYPLMLFLKCMDDEDELDSLIKREIESRTNFILCDSDNAKVSKWVQKEVLYIKSLGRNYETIDIEEFSRNLKASKATIRHFSKRTKIILSFDRDHEGVACKMYTRLQKYDFKLLLNPLYKFEAAEYYDCIKDSFADLIEIGLVVVIAGDWVADLKNPLTRNLLLALEKNKTNAPTFLMLMVLEKKIHKAVQELYIDFKNQYYSFDTQSVFDRVDNAVDQVLARVLTPSSMLVYIEAFKKCSEEGYDEEAACLTRLLFEKAQLDNAGDLIALGKCYENGWGCEKDLKKAGEYYLKAQEIVGDDVFCDDVLRVEQKREAFRPKKLSIWKRILLRVLSWFD